MKDVFDSIFHQFNNRMKTPFYGLLGSWWIVFHWPFFYTLLFVSEDKIFERTQLLKNEYLRQTYVPGGSDFWWHQLWLFVAALVLTLLMIFIIPRYILVPIYKWEQDDEFEKRKKRIEMERRTEAEKTRYEKQATEAIRQQTVRFDAQQKLKKAAPEEIWANEYEALQKMDLYQYFDQMIRCLYRYNGQISTTNGSFRLDRDLLAYADANGLVAFDRAQAMIEPTEKGRYFIKRYQADNK